MSRRVPPKQPETVALSHPQKLEARAALRRYLGLTKAEYLTIDLGVIELRIQKLLPVSIVLEIDQMTTTQQIDAATALRWLRQIIGEENVVILQDIGTDAEAFVQLVYKVISEINLGKLQPTPAAQSSTSLEPTGGSSLPISDVSTA